MITWRAGTGRTVTDDYLESWDRQDMYRLLLGELGQVGQVQMITQRAGTSRTLTGNTRAWTRRTVTDDYLENWDRQDRYRYKLESWDRQQSY